MPLWRETWVHQALQQADAAAAANDPYGVADGLRQLPVELFLLLYLEYRPDYPNLMRWLPGLPGEDDQRLWTGNAGLYMLQQGVGFIDRMFAIHGKNKAVDWNKVRVLDYGCGWGRLIRILYRYVAAPNIVGADPWPVSLDRCRERNVHADLVLVDYVPKSLPDVGVFDLIMAYSVFTHISERAQLAALSQFRKVIAPDGVLALTIRQENFWPRTAWPDEELRRQLLATHFEKGFAHMRHSEEDTPRATDYGETSQTLDYIRKTWTEWRVDSVDLKLVDEFQTCVYLRPA